MAKKVFVDEGWTPRIVEARTQCKHGAGSCARCGTSDTRDVVHYARTPNRRTLRRQRRKVAAK